MRPARDMGSAFGIVWDPRLWAVKLAIVTFVVSVLLMASRYLGGAELLLQHLFVLRPGLVLHGEVWQLVTYSLAQPGTFNLIFAVYALLAFGTTVEIRLGSKAFLGYFFGLAVVGGLVTVVASLVFPSIQVMPYFGAAVSGVGLLVIWARLHRGAMVYFIFFPMKAEMLLVITLVLMGLSALESGPALLIPEFSAFFAAELAMRADGDLNPRRMYLRFRAWQIERNLRKRARNFTVLPGGDDERSGRGRGPDGGFLN